MIQEDSSKISIFPEDDRLRSCKFYLTHNSTVSRLPIFLTVSLTGKEGLSFIWRYILSNHLFSRFPRKIAWNIITNLNNNLTKSKWINRSILKTQYITLEFTHWIVKVKCKQNILNKYTSPYYWTWKNRIKN